MKIDIGQKSRKWFYVAEKYVRTVMFKSGIERFCTSEMSGLGWVTFWRHQKDTMLRTQKCLKTGKKRR